MKILCPFDFSSASTNAVEYAAGLANKFNSSLTLLFRQKIPVKAGLHVLAGSENENALHSQNIENDLQDFCKKVNSNYRIPCNLEIVRSAEPFENLISDETCNHDLVVIGTSGVDNIYESYFGSQVYSVAKNSFSPVLMVPEKSKFKHLEKIVFASDYNKGDDLRIDQLKKFLHSFNPELIVLHISKEDTAVGQEVFNSFYRLAEEVLDYNQKINFKRSFSENQIKAIDEFMIDSGSDILTLYLEEHDFLYRVFHKNLVKELTSLAHYPVMIFRES